MTDAIVDTDSAAASARDENTDHAEASAVDSDDALISRLRVIEQQPLDERAPAYAALHDSLSHSLESGHSESPRSHA